MKTQIDNTKTHIPVLAILSDTDWFKAARKNRLVTKQAFFVHNKRPTKAQKARWN